MGNKVGSNRPKNKMELQKLLIHVWYHEITIEYIKELVNSMPRRIKAVIQAKGGSTKY